MEYYLKKLRQYLPQITFCTALLWLLWQLAPILFATHDDLRNDVLVRRGTLMADAVRMAKDGRISHLWNHLLLGLPFAANKVWFYKLCQYAALIFDIYAGWLLLKTHTERRFADLTAVLALSWACISDQHNLLISYALGHQISLGFALLALHHFGNRMKKRDARETVKSSVFLLLSVMIYEAFAAILFVMLLWALAKKSKRPCTFFTWLRRATSRIRPQLLTIAAYCVIYFIWQHIFPPVYDGIALDLHEPVLSLSALMTFSTGNFPLKELAWLSKTNALTVPALLHLLSPAAWLCALLTAALFYRTLPRIRMENGTLRAFLVISGSGVLAPCVLVACSQKYLGWLRENVRAYLPSFYSFIFLTAFLLALALLIYRAASDENVRKTWRVLLTVAVGCICLSASAVNAVWKPYFAGLLERYRNFDYAVSAALPDLGEGAQLYAPDNPGIHNDRGYSEDYLKIYNPVQIAYISDADALSAGAETLCIRMPEDYAFSVTGSADVALRAQSLTFRTLETDAFNITLYDTEGEAVYYENVRNGNLLTLPAGKYFDLRVQPCETEK